MDVKIVLCVLLAWMSVSSGWNSFQNPDGEIEDVGFDDVRADRRPREDDAGLDFDVVDDVIDVVDDDDDDVDDDDDDVDDDDDDGDDEEEDDKRHDVGFDDGEGFGGFNGFNRSQQGRIVGGIEITKHRWNFMVLVQKKTDGAWTQWCGGTILNPTTVVSASHCYSGYKPADFQVVAGEHDYTKKEGDEQFVGVKEIIIHPDYEHGKDRFLNDVTVLKLSSALTFNSAVKPYGLNTESTCPGDNDKCYIAGWGKTSYPNGKSSNVPLQTNVHTQSTYACFRIYNPYSYSRKGQLCVGGSGNETCHGDSGGPLVCNCDGWKLAGITSHGIPCGIQGKPSAYVSVLLPQVDHRTGRQVTQQDRR